MRVGPYKFSSVIHFNFKRMLWELVIIFGMLFPVKKVCIVFVLLPNITGIVSEEFLETIQTIQASIV